MLTVCWQVGWPMMLPSKERRQFAGKVHDLKKKHLNNMVMDGKLPLRPGVYIYASAHFAPQPYLHSPCHATPPALSCSAAVTHFVGCHKSKACKACMALLCGNCRINLLMRLAALEQPCLQPMPQHDHMPCCFRHNRVDRHSIG